MKCEGSLTKTIEVIQSCENQGQIKTAYKYLMQYIICNKKQLIYNQYTFDFLLDLLIDKRNELMAR